MPITIVPFSGGLNTHIDTRLLPDGALSDVVNAEMDRSGRLVGRAKYTAQSATVYDSGVLTAYDLFQFNDRLFAFGDAQSYGYPSDVFEYCPSGVAAQWRPTSTENEATPRLPRATAVRDMCRPPDQPDGINNMGCAATAGHACLVWNVGSGVDYAFVGFVHVVNAAKNQPLVFAKIEDVSGPVRALRVVGLSDRFIVIGLNTTDSAINTAVFIPASSETVTNLAANIMTTAGAVGTYAVCKVDGSDEFMVVANLNGTVTTRRYNAAGVLQVPSGGQYSTQAVVPTRLAIEASSTANQVNIAMVISGEARIFSYDLSTGAQIGAGPHVPFTGETSVEISLVRISSTIVQIVSSVTSETAPTIFTRRYTVSTNTFGTLRKAVTDAQLTTSAVFSTETVFGMRNGLATVGNTPNMLVSFGDGTDQVTPLVAKDLEVCETVSNLLPDICRDSSTGKFYWTNSVANPDGSSIPQLTEFMLTSTSRRQTAQLGNLVYIGGGSPLVFDGLNLSESGFHERPRIISLTPSNGSGQLLSGATYKYRLHWEWIDSDGNLHLSPPSAIEEVDLGGTDDTVTAVVTTPHSIRRNVGNPTGTVACVLSRTLGTVSHTTATITGSANVDPPSSSLNGLTLFITISDTTGYNLYTVTFDAGSTTAAAIVVDIDAIVSRVTVSNEDGHIKLVADEAGEGAYLEVSGGTAAEILGFGVYQGDRGTTTYTVGENFQRTCVGYTLTSGAVAEYKTLTDLTKDQSDPIVDTDLIRQQVLYSQGVASGAHHAPPPGEYIWAGRERVLVAGQPKRSRWTVSKTMVPAEPAEFAFEGFLGYSNTVTGDIEACAVMGDSLIFWTRHQIWQVAGSGPNRAGQGEFFAPQCISKAGGLVADGWRSLVETDEGIWFQRASDQLCILTKGGSVEWRGMEVQDKLQLYPVVVAGCYCSTKHSVVFAVQSTDGLTGGLLRYDIDAKMWAFDDVGAVASLSTYQGRLVYVQAGIVYIQDASPGSGTFVGYSVTTGMFQGFQVLGYGQLNEIGILGTFRGDCIVTISLSVNGTTFDVLDTFSLTTGEYTVGQRVRLMKAPAIMQYDSFAVKVAITGTNDSEGLWLHALALDTETQPDLYRVGAAHDK